MTHIIFGADLYHRISKKKVGNCLHQKQQMSEHKFLTLQI